MKLYKISQTENDHYDTYDSAIVCADSEEDARLIFPDDNRYVWDIAERRWIYFRLDGTKSYYASNSWVSHPDEVTVEYIGEAKETMTRGIILASFNAG